METMMIRLLLAMTVLVAASAQMCETSQDHPVLHCKDQQVMLQIGSATAYPIYQNHGVRYANPLLAPLSVSAGSSLGFSNFFGGASDIAPSSRRLLPKDYANADCDPAHVTDDGTALQACQGRLPVGVKIAKDRLAIVVSPRADWIPEEGVTYEQVLQMFNVQNASEWGVLFPDGPERDSRPVLPDPSSGTLDFFEEVTGLNMTRPEPGSSYDFLFIRNLVARHTYNVAFVPYFLVAGGSAARVLPIDGMNPLDLEVESYPFERALYKFFDAAPGADNKRELDFICALLDVEGQDVIRIAGHIPLSEEERAAEFEKLGCESRNAVNSLDKLTGMMQQASFCRDSVKLMVLGSSTVHPVMEEVARTYPNPLVGVIARSTGSSIGLRNLLTGVTDLAMSSRALQPSDYAAQSCDPEFVVNGDGVEECNDVVPRGLQIGTDMLAVVVHPDSELSDVTIDDLQAIFVDQSRGMTLYVPDANSGTRSYFEERVGPIAATGFADDQQILNAVASDVNGIGFLGAAYAMDPRVKVLSVNGVSPQSNDLSYAMARPLFLYYNGGEEYYSKAAEELMCWMLKTNGGQRIVQNLGYLPVDESVRVAELTELECTELKAR